MAYVVYRSPQHTVQVQRRKRSPAGKFAAWCVKKASGTVLQGAITFFAESRVGHVAVAISVGLLLGALLDLSFEFLSGPHSFIVCAIVGTVVGGAVGGAAGAVVGFFWGWLVGVIADAIVSKLTFDPIVNIIGRVGAWCLAATLGWLAARTASWCFEKVTRNRGRLRGVLASIFVTIALASIAIGLFELGTLVGAHHAVIWSTIVRWAPTIGRWAAVVLVWCIAIAIPILCILLLKPIRLPDYDPITRRLLFPSDLTRDRYGLYEPTENLLKRMETNTPQAFWDRNKRIVVPIAIVCWSLWVLLSVFITRWLL
jgi:MFS family permease